MFRVHFQVRPAVKKHLKTYTCIFVTMETNNSLDVVEHQKKEENKAQEEKESHDANIANGVNEGALIALSAYS